MTVTPVLPYQMSCDSPISQVACRPVAAAFAFRSAECSQAPYRADTLPVEASSSQSPQARLTDHQTAGIQQSDVLHY